jgi:hypothetical protein
MIRPLCEQTADGGVPARPIWRPSAALVSRPRVSRCQAVKANFHRAALVTARRLPRIGFCGRKDPRNSCRCMTALKPKAESLLNLVHVAEEPHQGPCPLRRRKRTNSQTSRYVHFVPLPDKLHRSKSRPSRRWVLTRRSASFPIVTRRNVSSCGITRGAIPAEILWQ